MSPALVLTTVNAPHSEQLDAQQLAHCLLDQTAAKTVPGHMSAFFGEVEPALQVGFASMFEITNLSLRLPRRLLPRIRVNPTRSLRERTKQFIRLGTVISSRLCDQVNSKQPIIDHWIVRWWHSDDATN